LKASPQHTPAGLTLAELQFRSGAPQAALDLLEPVVEREPHNAQALKLLGIAYLAAHEPNKATEIFRSMVAMAPEDPRMLYWLGVGLSAKGRFDEAHKAFETALAIEPNYTDLLVMVIRIADLQQRAESAAERVKQQLVLVPNSGPLYYLLGVSYLWLREEDKAERYCQMLWTDGPNQAASFTPCSSFLRS
jgi:Flp pilus assembly protein TadD